MTQTDHSTPLVLAELAAVLAAAALRLRRRAALAPPEAAGNVKESAEPREKGLDQCTDTSVHEARVVDDPETQSRGAPP